MKRGLGCGLLLSSLLLTACWSRQGLPVERISESQYLLQAQTLSVEAFFAKRMQNQPRKARVGNWLILYEDMAFVYLGYPHFDGFSDRRSVPELYRTSKASLQQAFPGYAQIAGNDVRLAAQTALTQALGFPVSLPTGAWWAELREQAIWVTAQPQAEQLGEQSGQVTYLLRLAASDLRLEHLHPLP